MNLIQVNLHNRADAIGCRHQLESLFSEVKIKFTFGMLVWLLNEFMRFCIVEGISKQLEDYNVLQQSEIASS